MYLYKYIYDKMRSCKKPRLESERNKDVKMFLPKSIKLQVGLILNKKVTLLTMRFWKTRGL